MRLFILIVTLFTISYGYGNGSNQTVMTRTFYSNYDEKFLFPMAHYD